MTLHAVLEIGNLLMFICDVADCVFVTSIAGIGGCGAWMTGCACDSSAAAVIEREGMFEVSRLPGCGGVTG